MVGDYGSFQMVLQSNMAQTVLSGDNILLNGIFASIPQATEWDGYTGERKGLRVFYCH